MKHTLASDVRTFVLRGFKPRYGELAGTFPANGLWGTLASLGTQLWLDTGNMAEAGKLWTGEMSALTTNNTLLNAEVQTGRYDALVKEAAALLDKCGSLSATERRLELAFILNAHHGLRLVEMFDARVSVEEHTDLAQDLDGAVAYGRRYHEICPERFIVKLPFTPEGLLATRRLAAEGIAVNHTLGFSARQNYVVTALARPHYVNVFLGRLNAFALDNQLGDGALVGERATVASQQAVRRLRQTLGAPTRQIAASLRSGQQIRDLAGVDVMTMPPKAAQQFLDLGLQAANLKDCMGRDYRPLFAAGVDLAAVGLPTLWDIDDTLVACVDAARNENLDAFTGSDLAGFFADHGCGDLFVRWTSSEIATSAAEGKIPKLSTWREALASGHVGLDSLMNLAGLNSFRADQKAMDDRVAGVLAAK